MECNYKDLCDEKLIGKDLIVNYLVGKDVFFFGFFSLVILVMLVKIIFKPIQLIVF